MPGPERLEILAIAPWQIEKVHAEVDVFYNRESLVEMRIESVRNYAGQVSRLMRNTQANVCLWSYRHDPAMRVIHPDVVRGELVQALEVPIEHFEPAYTLDDESVWMRGSTAPM